jgi:hypothetical protein
MLVNSQKERIAAAEIIVVQIDPYFGLRRKIATVGNFVGDNPALTQNWAVQFDELLRQKVRATAPISEKMAWFFHQLGGRLGLYQAYGLNYVLLPSGNWDGGNRVLGDADARAESGIIARNYFDRAVDLREVLDWKQFMQSLAALQPRVLLIYLPSSPGFEEEEHAYADVVAENRRIFEELARENKFELTALTSAQCGLNNQMFADPIHVNHAGRERMSECFAQTLARVFPDR